MRRRKGQSQFGFIEPMQPTLVDEPPDGDTWLHEVKWDGYRTEVFITNGKAVVYTRRGHHWTEKYLPIAQAAEALPCQSAIIDGEMIVADEQGRSSFRELRSAITSNPQRLVLVVFDLLHLDGQDLRDRPLTERRQALQDLVRETGSAIQFSEELSGDGASVYRAVDRLGLEGMVSKERSSPYRSGPTMRWQKIKCYATDEFEIIAVERERGKVPVALLNKGGKYVGAAIISLNRRLRERLWERVEAKKKPSPARFARERPAAQLVQPGLFATVQFLKGEETLRHASVREWREDED